MSTLKAVISQLFPAVLLQTFLSMLVHAQEATGRVIKKKFLSIHLKRKSM